MTDLPPLHAAWMSGLLPTIPPETRADCGDCVMCPGRGAEPEEAFAPESRCCTYVPAIPNFLVGRALADPQLEGRRSLEARLAGEAVSPLGLGVVEEDQERYRTLKAAGLFGKPGAGLRCPHYLEDGRCGIWRHRPAVCATWFCRHERGRVGLEFWTSIRRLLAKVEDSLSVWCVLRAGWEPAALEALFPEDGPPDLARAWGDRRGREAEFFRECAARVEGLGWDEVLRIGGAGVEALAALAGEGFRRLLDTRLPDRVSGDEFRVSKRPEGFRLRGYRASDWIDVPPAVLDLLLDLGEAPPVNLAVPEGLIRRLLDLGILAAKQPL